MTRKRKMSDSYNDERDCKQRQRMTNYNLNHIFRKSKKQIFIYIYISLIFSFRYNSTEII